MKNGCHASFSTIRKFLRDVIAVPVSRGYLSKLIGQVRKALAPAYEVFMVRILFVPHLNVD
ncbi:MAG: hypothetical protein GY927_02955 [bacterium]|nr:hypothetical protein [bacterium]